MYIYIYIYVYTSAGVAIYCYEEPDTKLLIARAARVLDGVTSSLLAELIALELGLDLFTRILGRCVS